MSMPLILLAIIDSCYFIIIGKKEGILSDGIGKVCPSGSITLLK